MSGPDLNLLTTLDILLTEGSVARAAKRLRLSPSAMSRALTRLRDTLGDPLLVRAGRGLVPTPRALELRDQAGRVAREAEALLRPAPSLDLAKLDRVFTMRNREGFVELFGPDLIARVARQAPRAILRFVPKPDKDSTPLRDGSVDMETAVVGSSMGPELRTQALFEDRFVGVTRDKPAPRNAEEFAARRHILVSRRGLRKSAIGEELEKLSLERAVGVIVGSFSEAIALAQGTDMIACVPSLYTEKLREGLTAFELPFVLPPHRIALVWHPRFDADPAHRWLRDCVREVCAR